MKKEKGFTLVELLAVIVIIAIILAIAIPTISNYKEERKKNLFFALAKNIVRELNYENMETNSSLFNILGSIDMEISKEQVDLDKSNVLISEDGVVLNLFGKGAYEGLYLCDITSSTKSPNYENTTCIDGSYKSVVTLDAQGGSVEPTTLEVTAGNEYGELPTPTKENSDFIGWYYNGTKIENNTKVTTIVNHTIVAKWKYHAKLTVLLNGGTLDQTFEERYLEGTSLTLGTPTKDENTFVGWKITSGNGIISGNNLIFEDTDIIIEAQFRFNKIELVVDFDGGTGINPSGNYDIGSSIQITPPTKPGYDFTGWEVISGNSIISGNTITIGNQNTIAKATYQSKTFIVTLNANGGSVTTDSMSVAYNSTYGEFPTATRSGYNFIGWFTTASGTEQVLPSTVVKISSNQTLYAKWEEKIINTTTLLNSYKCKNKSVGVEEYVMTYTGNCDVTETEAGEFQIKFLTSGTLRINGSTNVDIFAVGAGGGGSSTTGGGGGYTAYKQNVSNITNQDIEVAIGTGGAVGANGTASSVGDIISAAGGNAGGTTGGNGGNGGGGYGGTKSEWACTERWDQAGCVAWGYVYTYGNGGSGGSYGKNGSAGTVQPTDGGTGQGTTTCEFNEGNLSGCTSGVNYAYSAGGYGCGTKANGSTGKGKTGDNSGHGGNCNASGSSGVIVIRSRNTKNIVVGSKTIGTYDGKFIVEGDESNWIVRFLTDGTLKFNANTEIDVFAVGAGGGGSSTTGGGGGYTNYVAGATTTANSKYSVVIGKGGDIGTSGGDSSLSTIITAKGGGGGSTTGGNGGNGGGGYGGTKSEWACTERWDQAGCVAWGYVYTYGNGGSGGSYGKNGSAGTVQPTDGGTGQGTTTCEFNEGNLSGCTSGVNYAYSAGGYGCGTKANGSNGLGKSGSNSGSGGSCQSTGQSGVIIIRNKR